jgi:hypothetical protein
MNQHPALVRRIALVVAAFGLCAAGLARAQEARDPTLPPPAVNAAAAGDTPSALPVSAESLSIVVRDGTPWLVLGTRLYKQGQLVGQYRIERISETEVWLRNGRELHKIARFAGITRRAAAPERSTP